MIDNPKSFIIIILAFITSLALITGATRSFVAESERNSTYTISVHQAPRVSTQVVNPTTPPKVNPVPNVPPPPPSKADFVIYLTKDGFNPKNLTIKSGKTVRFINSTTGSMRIFSPLSNNNTGLPELNQSKSVGKNGVYDFTFNKKGTFFYNNNNNASVVGVIVVL